MHMSKYFFTFGSDKSFPYQNGWVEVHADSWAQAEAKFRARFPDRHENTLNCAFTYDEAQWGDIDPERNWPGWKCYEIIE